MGRRVVSGERAALVEFLVCRDEFHVPEELTFPALSLSHKKAQKSGCLPKLVLAHLIEQRRQRANLAFVFVECVGCLEIFVAASAPQPAIAVDHK